MQMNSSFQASLELASRLETEELAADDFDTAEFQWQAVLAYVMLPACLQHGSHLKQQSLFKF